MKLTEAIVIKYSNKQLAVLILVAMPLLLSIVAILSFIVAGIVIYGYLIVALVYGLKLRKYSAAQYFTEKGSENALIEYEYIKKIVYVEFPILIVIVLIIYLIVPTLIVPTVSSESSEEPTGRSLDERFESFFSRGIDPILGLFALIYNLSFSVIAGVLRIVIPFRKRDFRFYFAKALLWIASKEKEETKKTKYLIECIKSYDRYLREILNLQINDSKEIYSKLIIDSSIDKSEVIQSLSTSFENDNDKLAPAKHLAEITKVQKTQNFLVEQSIWQIIKDLAIFFAAIIPVVITIIQFLFQTTKSSP